MTFRPALIALTLTLGCTGQTPPKPRAVAVKKYKKPAVATYNVVRDLVFREGEARYVKARISKEVSREVLLEISEEIKSKGDQNFRFMLIYFFLPETMPGVQMPIWATCSFHPADQAKFFIYPKHRGSQAAKELSKDISLIGFWNLDAHYTVDNYAIYKEKDQYLLTIVSQGNVQTYELEEVAMLAGRRYRNKKIGTIFEIDATGILRISKGDGKQIAAAMPAGWEPPETKPYYRGLSRHPSHVFVVTHDVGFLGIVKPGLAQLLGAYDPVAFTEDRPK